MTQGIPWQGEILQVDPRLQAKKFKAIIAEREAQTSAVKLELDAANHTILTLKEKIADLNRSVKYYRARMDDKYRRKPVKIRVPKTEVVPEYITTYETESEQEQPV